MTLRTLIFALFATLFGAERVQAQDCPVFYRFVDFGLVDSAGGVHRGGAIFRVESFDGRPILSRELTECRAVHEIASDGHGNPIPVVTRFGYDPKKMSLDVAELKLAVFDDAVALADANAKAHRARLNRSETVMARGQTYLCSSDPFAAVDAASCQIVSPYGDAPLVVYCDGLRCEMPVLSVDDRIVLSAAWAREEQDLDALGMAIAAKVQTIYDTLETLSSGL